MINKLILKNFKKVEDSTIEFTEGLNALRGANEAGKSTRYHAIMYALFGSRSLPLSLADTVTYGKPENSLAVELEFTHEGQRYKIVRSKSGAQLTCAANTAQGQSEVTRYVENLFGLNADTASKLMVASQNGLRGALEGGNAVALIEGLANISVIDNLVSKIQDQLPSGNTKALAEQLEQIEEGPEPLLDITELETKLEANQQATSEISVKISDVTDEICTYDEAVLIKKVREVTKAVETEARLKREVTVLEEKVQDTVFPDLLDVSALQTEQEAYFKWMVVRQAYAKFKQFKQPEDVAGVSGVIEAENLSAEILKANVTKSDGTKLLQKLAVERASKIATRINEHECTLCGKLLQDVPEVVSKNASVDIHVAALEAEMTEKELELVDIEMKLTALMKVQKQEQATAIAHAELKAYTSLSSSLPRRLQWDHALPEEEVNIRDYTAEIKQAETYNRKVLQDKAVCTERKTALGQLQKQLSELVVDLKGHKEAEDDLLLLRLLYAKLDNLKVKGRELLQEKLEIQHEITLKKKDFIHQHQAWGANIERKTQMKAALAEQQKNNALIKKLREVRPVVASRLWSIVLGSVSTHFSQIRGTQSTVTRNESTFLVDGKVVGGLSGSTLDSLGLAIRMALGKTFLPSINFLLLDEPSAGMDDEREAAMLGVLAASSYSQVILVTHSNLADSFATTVIEI